MERKSKLNNLMTKADAKDLPYSTGISDVAETLVRARARGKNVYYDFNGQKLYSADATTVDYAYQEVYGCTKEEFERKRILTEREYDKKK